MTYRGNEFKFSEATRISLPAALLVACSIFLLGTGAIWANLKGAVDEIPEIKARVAKNEQTIAKIDVIANDIAWIKAQLVREQMAAATKGGGGSR